MIKKAAEAFASSGRAVPVFIKHRVGEWRYVGNYRVSKLSVDPADIKSHAQRAGRKDVTCVLHLSEVE
jgi:hypothetical protein